MEVWPVTWWPNRKPNSGSWIRKANFCFKGLRVKPVGRKTDLMKAAGLWFLGNVKLVMVHGKLVQEATEETTGRFRGRGGNLMERIGRLRQHSGSSVFGFFCFVLAAAWQVVESFRYASDLVEQLCNFLMQLLWRVMPRSDENLRGLSLRLMGM